MYLMGGTFRLSCGCTSCHCRCHDMGHFAEVQEGEGHLVSFEVLEGIAPMMPCLVVW